MAFQMHHGDDKQFIARDVIDDCVRKAMGEAAMGLRGEFRPGSRKTTDAVNGTTDFCGEFKTEAGELVIVVRDRVVQLAVRCGEKGNGADSAHLERSANTSSAGMAENSPRLNASIRSSAS